MARRINLLPHSERARTTTDFGMLAMVVAMLVVVFAVGLGYFVFSARLDTKERELADVRQQVTQLQSQVAALEHYSRLSAQTEQTEAVVQQVYASRTLVTPILDSLSLVIPEDAWFRNLSLETPDPVLQGGAVPGATPTRATISIDGNTYGFDGVAQVLVRLQLLSALRDVTLVSAGEPRGTTDPALDVTGFTITAEVINDRPIDTPLPMSRVEVVSP